VRKGGGVYTSGTWTVKKGHGDEFARAWQQAVDAIVLTHPGLKFMLLRDSTDPRKFLSLGEGWRNAEQIESVRADASYQESMASVEKLVETGEVSLLDLVVEVS
jgi:quinol monooxygenase YgiN